MGIQIKNLQFNCVVEFLDDKGTPVTPEGVPTWSVSDPAMLDCGASPDGMSATISSLGPAGQGNVSAKAKTEKGDVTEFVDVTVSGQGEAEGITVKLTPGRQAKKPVKPAVSPPPEATQLPAEPKPAPKATKES